MRTIHLKRGTSLRRTSASAAAQLHQPSSFISRQAVAQVLRDENRRLKSVCFTGHRHIPPDAVAPLAHRLDSVLEKCYLMGYREFLCGGALGFDVLAAERVLGLQAQHPDVRLIMVIPCANQALRWSENDCRRYERILYAASETRVLAPGYYDGCMQVRNRHMVDHSSLCICYLNKMKGGTMSTVAYALNEHVPILNAAMEDACAAFIQKTVPVT